jgi:hypothetical protein
VPHNSIPEKESFYLDHGSDSGINALSCPLPVINLAVPSKFHSHDDSPLMMPSTEAIIAVEERRVSIQNVDFAESENSLQLSVPMPTRQEICTFKKVTMMGMTMMVK